MEIKIAIGVATEGNICGSESVSEPASLPLLEEKSVPETTPELAIEPTSVAESETDDNSAETVQLLRDILIQMQELTAAVKEMQQNGYRRSQTMEETERYPVFSQEYTTEDIAAYDTEYSYSTGGGSIYEPESAERALAEAVARSESGVWDTPERLDGTGQQERSESREVPEADPKKDRNPKKPARKRRFAWVGEIFFYLLLIVAILGAYLVKSSSDGRPVVVAGYSVFTVLTGSMEDVIPRGSLILTKRVEPELLQVGDDITYMVSEMTTITHRIIGITENYSGTGERAFETQGVMNEKPDKELVPAVNVIGKVIFHSKLLGTIADFITKNWPILVFALVVLVALYLVLKRILREQPEEDIKQIDTPKAKGRT